MLCWSFGWTTSEDEGSAKHSGTVQCRPDNDDNVFYDGGCSSGEVVMVIDGKKNISKTNKIELKSMCFIK